MIMYGVSKISVEPGVMMISVQDAAFSAGSLARYLQIFADTGIVVDMISQSAPTAPSWISASPPPAAICPW